MGKEINYELIAELIEEKLIRNHEKYIDKYPHISNICTEGEKTDYTAEDNSIWTSSFFPGEMFLAYEMTGNDIFLSDLTSYLKSFETRLDNRVGISHDLGFLYTLSCVAPYKLLGDKKAKAIALKAADILFERYNSKGKFIQAWGEMNQSDSYVKMIADTMLNLPLLYWTGKEEYIKAAENHAMTCGKYIVRDDYSSYHTFLMDPVSGDAIEGRTHQGYRDDSTWARGQAWIVYGFALSYGYTHKPIFLDIAEKSAEYFIERLPNDYVPYWDLTFNDTVPDIKDTSAAAILASGLLELAGYVDAKEKKSNYIEVSKRILTSLYDKYFVNDMDSPVLLRDGMYHRDNGSTGTIWGDYFFFEALVRLTCRFKRFW